MHDAGMYGGLFAPIGVGEGKTLVTLLLPVVMRAQRPLLLLPGGLVEKTQRDRLRYSRHWQIPNTLRVFSYDMLGRVEAVDELETYQPDLIIGDEIHRLKNKRAARTRRVARYMVNNPTTMFAGLSGSIMDRSLHDFAHILLWCLKFGAPIPKSSEEIEEWAQVLDVGVNPWERPSAGALLEFCEPADTRDGDFAAPEHVAARRGFCRRLTQTPGVVATVGEGEHIGASIYIRGIVQKAAPVTEHNFLILRGDGSGNLDTEFPGWQTPDGWELTSAAEVWAKAQELALGLHYIWDPRPPLEWREARREWDKFVRETIARSRTWDSPLHVANAVDAGHLKDGGRLERWRKIEPTFAPNVVPIWHDDSALKVCAKWAETPGIIWTGHNFFAERLSQVTGLPYFAQGGFAADGRYIEDCKPGSSAIVSIDANREGKNLQEIWSRNLIVCPPSSGQWCEQTIARTHRTGQKADEVIVDILIGCRENYDAILSALDGARAVQDMTGKKQKLLLATVELPTVEEIDAMRSPRWIR